MTVHWLTFSIGVVTFVIGQVFLRVSTKRFEEAAKLVDDASFLLAACEEANA